MQVVWELGSDMTHFKKPETSTMEEICNKFTKDFKNGPHQKEKILKEKGKTRINIYGKNK